MNNVLLSWLNLKQPFSDDIKYKYFVLDWKEYKNPKAKWLTQEEFKSMKNKKSYILFNKFTFRQSEINVIGPKELSEFIYYPPTRGYTNIVDSISISLLQKLIRRQMNKFAIVTSKNLLQFHFTKFIRRLSIIMVEDTEYIHEPFQVICWLMCSNCTKWPLFVYEWLLGVVNLLCIYPINLKAYSDINEPKSINAKIDNQFSMSVQIRRSWGMTQCDSSMFGRLLNVNQKNIIKSFGKYQYISFPNIQPLSLDIIKDYGLFGVDFHCSNIIQLIHDETGISQSEIKLIIWQNISSLNKRDKIIRRSKKYLRLKPVIEKCAIRCLFDQQRKFISKEKY